MEDSTQVHAVGVGHVTEEKPPIEVDNHFNKISEETKKDESKPEVAQETEVEKEAEVKPANEVNPEHYEVSKVEKVRATTN